MVRSSALLTPLRVPASARGRYPLSAAMESAPNGAADPITGARNFVVRLGDTAVRDSSDLYRALDELRGGDAVKVRVRRGAEGKEVTLNMVLGGKVTRFGPT